MGGGQKMLMLLGPGGDSNGSAISVVLGYLFLGNFR